MVTLFYAMGIAAHIDDLDSQFMTQHTRVIEERLPPGISMYYPYRKYQRDERVPVPRPWRASGSLPRARRIYRVPLIPKSALICLTDDFVAVFWTSPREIKILDRPQDFHHLAEQLFVQRLICIFHILPDIIRIGCSNQR